MLKKIIMFFVTIFLCMNIVNANESKMFYLDDPIPGVYTLMDKVYKKAANYVKVIRRKSDNAFVYCVSPGIAIDSEGTYSDYQNNQWGQLNISEEKWQRINLIAYYGYGYLNHQDLTWYAVTQYLIWLEVLPVGWDVYFTDKLRGERTNKFDDDINELKRLVDSYYVNPTIDLNIKLNYGDSLNLVDNNNVLENYQLVGNDKITKNGNVISIKNATNSFSFKLELKTSRLTSILYMYPDAQSVISRGDLPYKEFVCNVNVEKGKIKLIKKRDELVNLDFISDKMSLGNAKYSIYNDNYYREYQTNDRGEFITNDLPIGKYYIKELNPSNGYELDPNIYEVDLNNNEIKELVIKEKPVMSQFDITKYYKEDDRLFNEEGALFAIYDLNNNLLVQKETDVDGKFAFNLPIGEYLLKQLSGKSGYYLTDDELIKVSGSNTVKKDIINEPILTEVEIIKVDDDNNVVVDQDFSFKIYDKNTNKYLVHNESYEFTFMDGKIVLPILLPYGNYIIEEVDNSNHYYETNAILEFKIDNTNHETLQLFLVNKRKKYSFSIYKEKEIKHNDEFLSVPGNNIEFCLFAKNNTILNNKIIYPKDSLITCQITDENGIAVFNDLVFGEYYLEENMLDKKYEKLGSFFIELNDNINYLKIVNRLKLVEEEKQYEEVEKPTLVIPNEIGKITYEFEQNHDTYVDNPKTKDNIFRFILMFVFSSILILVLTIFFLKSDKNPDFSKKIN